MWPSYFCCQSQADLKHSWKRWDPTTAGPCPIMHWARKTAGWVASLAQICHQIIKKKKKKQLSHLHFTHFRSRFTSGSWRRQCGRPPQGSRGRTGWQACVTKLCARCVFTPITPTITTASNQPSGDKMLGKACKSRPPWAGNLMRI